LTPTYLLPPSSKLIRLFTPVVCYICLYIARLYLLHQHKLLPVYNKEYEICPTLLSDVCTLYSLPFTSTPPFCWFSLVYFSLVLLNTYPLRPPPYNATISVCLCIYYWIIPPPLNDHLPILIALNIIYKHALYPTFGFIWCPFSTPLVVCTPPTPLQTLTQPLLLFRVNLLYLQTLLHTLKLYKLTLALALMHCVAPVIPSIFTVSLHLTL